MKYLLCGKKTKDIFSTNKEGRQYEEDKQFTHVLMNTSRLDEKWIYPILKKYIASDDHVCVLAFSFFKDVKNIQD